MQKFSMGIVFLGVAMVVTSCSGNTFETMVEGISSAVATPTFSPVEGTYSSEQNVAISSNTADAVICYTDDGSTTPSCNAAKDGCSAGNKYTAAIAVAGDGTSKSFKAMACKVGYDDSTLASATYAIHYPGTLDLSFGTGGKVTTPIGSGDDEHPMAIQSDGKIVVAGASDNGSDYDFAVVHYNTDGTLDTSFDGDGKVITPIGTGDDIARAIAIQSDGKIVVAEPYNNGSDLDFAVARYNSDGSLDTSFDGDGKVTTPIGSCSDYYCVYAYAI